MATSPVSTYLVDCISTLPVSTWFIHEQGNIWSYLVASSAAAITSDPVFSSVLHVQVYLDPKDRNSTEYKLDTFGSVYKKLTGKEVVFEFPISSGDIA